MINLTKHAIHIIAANGDLVTIPPSGQLAMVAMKPPRTLSPVEYDGYEIPVATVEYGEVVLPPDIDGLILVSTMTADAMRAQGITGYQVYVPDTGPSAIRDEKGRILSVVRLIRK